MNSLFTVRETGLESVEKVVRSLGKAADHLALLAHERGTAAKDVVLAIEGHGVILILVSALAAVIFFFGLGYWLKSSGIMPNSSYDRFFPVMSLRRCTSIRSQSLCKTVDSSSSC